MSPYLEQLAQVEQEIGVTREELAGITAQRDELKRQLDKALDENLDLRKECQRLSELPNDHTNQPEVRFGLGLCRALKAATKHQKTNIMSETVESDKDAGKASDISLLFGGLSVAIHSLKTWPQYFERVMSGEKTFEIRENDRGFQRGDMLHLQEYDPARRKDGPYVGGVGPSCYTGRECYMRVTYVTTFEQKEGYVVMAISPPNEKGMARRPDQSRASDNPNEIES